MRHRWGRGRGEEEEKASKGRVVGHRYMQREIQRVRVGQKGHTARDSSLPDGIAARSTFIDWVKVRRALERKEVNATVKGVHDEKDRGGGAAGSDTVIISFCNNQIGLFESSSFHKIPFLRLSHHIV